LGEVVRLMEGGITLTVCCGEKANECPRRDGCLTRRAWVQLSTVLEKELDSISLANLLQHGDAVCPEDSQRTKCSGKEAGKRKSAAAPEAPSGSPRTIIRRAKGLRR
jgi:DNA-binding IscR family transcriptional regulator